jgi:glycosyl hydrolase group 75 (putative chitosanase)
MAFRPPPASKRQLDGVPFDQATDFAPDAQKKFATKDRQAGNKDPSKCKALLKFPDNDAGPGAVFWSSKMAIDTDGPSAGPGRLNGKALDPASGQNDTSLHFANGKGLPSEIVPYIVLPQLEPGSSQTFNPAVAIGDVAVVIFKDKTAAALCGDIGPFNKIGEASIRVHEALQQQGCPDPCSKRDAKGFCQRARNSSVEQDVLYFVFPNSAFTQDELALETINTKLKERAFGLYNKLRGAS